MYWNPPTMMMMTAAIPVIVAIISDAFLSAPFEPVTGLLLPSVEQALAVLAPAQAQARGLVGFTHGSFAALATLPILIMAASTSIMSSDRM